MESNLKALYFMQTSINIITKIPLAKRIKFKLWESTTNEPKNKGREVKQKL